MDSDSNTSESNEAKSLAKPKTTAYAQKYKVAWKTDKNLQNWIQCSTKGRRHFYCKVCDAHYTTVGGKSNILKHGKSAKHISRASTLQKQNLVTKKSYAIRNNEATKQKEAEIRIASFVAEHNIPLSVADHLTCLIKAICLDSDVAKKITCARTKCTKIVQNVTGENQFQQVVKILQREKFSLIVDEYTDISSMKHLAPVTRYFHNDRVNDVFLALVPVPNATAQALYDKVVGFFAARSIPYKQNLIGFASDGASNMFGTHHSLSVLLRKDVENLFLMKCTCHSFALCASNACEKLPRIVEDLARDIYNYVAHSYKRLNLLKQFQEFVNIKPHKLLHPSQTRWLSLQQVVKRLLEQYDALVLYFTDAAFEDKLLAADMILQRLKEKYVRLYLIFLEFVLPLCTNLNLEMQSEETKIHRLYSQVSAVYKTLLNCYLKSDYVKNTTIENIDFVNPRNFVPIEEIYLGAKITAALSNGSTGLTAAELADFRKRCLQFYIEACTQIEKRFNFRSPTSKIFKDLSILNPATMESHNSIAPIASHFPNLVSETDLNELDSQWRELKSIDIEIDPQKSSIHFWKSVAQMKRGDDSAKFELLSKFMITLHCLPHSSATVERVFSQVQLNKTKIRNRLENDTLTGLLHTKALIGATNCYDFPVTERLIESHSIVMYDKKKSVSVFLLISHFLE